jgi:hypothetical protein
MVANIVSLLSKAFMPSAVNRTTAVRVTSSNPFANPFVTQASQNRFASYAKNNPGQGGYFAGYYNNRPNIVGQRLFIEA